MLIRRLCAEGGNVGPPVGGAGLNAAVNVVVQHDSLGPVYSRVQLCIGVQILAVEVYSTRVCPVGKRRSNPGGESGGLKMPPSLTLGMVTIPDFMLDLLQRGPAAARAKPKNVKPIAA